MTKELPELMSLKELQNYLKCSQTIVYTLVNDKRFPSIKIRGKWYIDKARLSVWLENQMRKPS